MSRVVRRLLWEEELRVPDKQVPKALGFMLLQAAGGESFS